MFPDAGEGVLVELVVRPAGLQPRLAIHADYVDSGVAHCKHHYIIIIININIIINIINIIIVIIIFRLCNPVDRSLQLNICYSGLPIYRQKASTLCLPITMFVHYTIIPANLGKGENCSLKVPTMSENIEKLL